MLADQVQRRVDDGCFVEAVDPVCVVQIRGLPEILYSQGDCAVATGSGQEGQSVRVSVLDRDEGRGCVSWKKAVYDVESNCRGSLVQ